MPAGVATRRNLRDRIFIAAPSDAYVYNIAGKLLRRLVDTSAPTAITTDKQDDVYVANSGANTVTEYARDGKTLLQTVSAGIQSPRSIAVGPTGNLYVANKSNVTVYTGPGFKLMLHLNVVAQRLAVDSASNLYVWIDTKNQGKIYVYRKGARKPTSRIVSGVALSGAFTTDNQNTLYVANRGSNSKCGGSVSVFPVGSTSPSLTIQQGICAPTAIAVDSQHTVYVANGGSNDVTIYAAGSNVLAFAITDSVNEPVSLAFDFRDNLYVLNSSTVTVYGLSSYSLESTLQVVSDGFQILLAP